jgi:hypothetical protein
MIDHVHARDRIERALDAAPYCPACGAPTTILEEDGQLVLRCAATVEPHGFAARFDAAMLPHIRQAVTDLGEDLAA